jgi:hypothetical protein
MRMRCLTLLSGQSGAAVFRIHKSGITHINRRRKKEWET